MRLLKLTCLSALACAVAVAADSGTNSATSTNLVDRGSYAFGATLGNNLRVQGAEPNVDLVIQGLKDGLANKSKIPETALRDDYMNWQRDVRSVRMEKNKKVGEQFLAEKAKDPEVKKFPDGLMYKVLATGKGKQPSSEDRVSAHYRGTLIDGTEFDSSYTRGQPLVTAVKGVVPGWQEALTNMHVGDKWELYVPPALGYGERGAGAKIGPNSTLIFEMELLNIEPPQTNAPTGPTINLGPGGNQPLRVTPHGANQPIRVQPAK